MSDIISDFYYFRQSSLDDTIEETAGPSRVSSSQRSIEVIPARTRNTSISMSDKVGQSPVTLHTSFRCRKVLKNILNIAIKNSKASCMSLGISHNPLWNRKRKSIKIFRFSQLREQRVGLN